MLTKPGPRSTRPGLLGQAFSALAGGVLLVVMTILAWTVGYQLLYAGRVFPGVSVAGIQLSGLSPNEVALRLSETLSYPITGKVLLRHEEGMWVASPAELGLLFDPSSSAIAAYRIGRAGGPFASLAGQLRAETGGLEVAPVVILDQRVAYTYLQRIAETVDQPVIEASLGINGTEVVATPGQVGRVLNLDATLILVGARLQTFRDGEVELVVQETAPASADLSGQAEAARRVLSQPLTLALPNQSAADPGPWVYEPVVLAPLLGVVRPENAAVQEPLLELDSAALRDMLANLVPLVDRQPANARFIFNDLSGQLDVMVPSQAGRSLDIEASILIINEAVRAGQHNVALVVHEQQPEVMDTASGADLGITELVYEYSTYFHGSSTERIQNIKTAVERFRGLLVPPGATFSMGEALGDVSLDNGFAEALIIYGGRTIKGVGGGVCQVSTTLFRAVFFAGFPVVQRVPHAYRVSYYERTASGAVDPGLAGLDATVYFPLVDFQFVNDTPHWLLMEAYVYEDARRLEWKLYSTSDGRTVNWTTTGPQNVVRAPSPLFEENRELDRNQIKQVDWAADGAEVIWTRTVYRNGQLHFTDRFETHYEEWQAICQYGPGTEEPEKTAKRKNLCLGPSG